MHRLFLNLTLTLTCCLMISACSHFDHDEAYIDNKAFRDAVIHTLVGINECVNQREMGSYKTHEETAKCGNSYIEYNIIPLTPAPDLVENYMEYRLEQARMVDQGKLTMTEAHSNLEERRKVLIQKEQQRRKLSNLMYDKNLHHSTTSAFDDFKCQPVAGQIKCRHW